jgi:hypothetical protein
MKNTKFKIGTNVTVFSPTTGVKLGTGNVTSRNPNQCRVLYRQHVSNGGELRTAVVPKNCLQHNSALMVNTDYRLG